VGVGQPAFSISYPVNYTLTSAATYKTGSSFPTYLGTDTSNNYFYASGFGLHWRRI